MCSYIAEMSHNKLAGTRSAPFSTPLNPANEESFTLPITSSDESHSASAIAEDAPACRTLLI